MAESPPSLRSFFLSAKAKETKLQHLDSSSDAYQENLRGAISAYEECQRLIQRSAVFSLNETSEDIATSTIQ
jgi:immunoglobulin-binding protein 1